MTLAELELALDAVERVLAEESDGSMDAGLAARKEAAVERLSQILSGPMAGLDLDDELAQRLQRLILSNGFSLRLSSFRAKLASIGAPRPEKAAPTVKMDLVI